jgi:hypothetical protein
MNLNLNSCLKNSFQTNLDNKLAYLYQIYAIIDIYKDSMSHEHSKQILENLIYLHTRIVKHHCIADYIFLNLDAKTKKPMLELGRKIEKNPIDKINFVLEAHNKFC